MTKRILALVMAALMVLSFAACGGSKEDAKNDVQIESSVALLDSIWSTLGEDEKFPVMGGDFSAPVDGGAGAFNLTDKENAVAQLHIAEADIALVSEAATIIHAMNANTFTAAAYRLNEGTDSAAFVASLKDSIVATQWMCGFPDTLVIYTIGDYVVAAFGNTDAITLFKTKLAAVYPDAALSVEEPLV
ncbi:MAG: hypothetical protein J6Q83_04315 [Clostridia bacterium]|nr:hypothetical protein [Clostridia bacterium]